MGARGRMDNPDTVEAAQHFLMKLAAEGWGVKSVKWEIEHGKATKNGRRIPVGATLVVHLVPEA